MPKLKLFYQIYSKEDKRSKGILIRIKMLEHVQHVLNRSSLSKKELECFFDNLYSVLSHNVDVQDSVFSRFYDQLYLQFEQLTQFTPQGLIDIIECQGDLFSFESGVDEQYTYQDENGDYYSFSYTDAQASAIEHMNVKEIKCSLIENLKNIENHITELKIEEGILSLEKKKLLTELSQEIMPNTELLLTIDASLDDDLMVVKDYREHKNAINNRGFLWIDIDTFLQLIKSFADAEWSELKNKITKLSILHHSGQRLLENEYDYSPHMLTIGNQLPYVSSVVLRGCGMAEETRSKDLAEKEQKKYAHYNSTSDFKWLKGEKKETTRQHTLDIQNSASGVRAASPLAASIITALKESSIGVNVGNVSIKLYVGPYKGDAEKGAEGLLGLHERYKRAPKALRFFMKEEAKSCISEQSDVNDELKQSLLSIH